LAVGAIKDAAAIFGVVDLAVFVALFGFLWSAAFAGVRIDVIRGFAGCGNLIVATDVVGRTVLRSRFSLSMPAIAASAPAVGVVGAV
jgi:hypothetical protein